MSISTIYFTKNFLPNSGDDYLIRTSQAADAEEMARVYAKTLAEIIAINDAIGPPGQNDQDKYMPVDAMLAGGGDGHTFVYSVTLARTRIAPVQQLLTGQQVIPVTPTGVAAFPGTGFPLPNSATDNPTLGAAPQPAPIPNFFLPPQAFVTRFAVASSQDAIQSLHKKMVDDLINEVQAALPGSPGIYCPFQGIAGAAKGTRFMVTVTGVPMLPVQS
jgi:hypothetical protein